MSEKREEIVELLALTEIALEVGDRAQARCYLTQLLELDPAHPRATKMLQGLQPDARTPSQRRASQPDAQTSSQREASPPGAPTLPAQEAAEPKSEDSLGAPFLAQCPVCRSGKLHWSQDTTISGQTSPILCTHCTSVLVPSSTQSSIGQFLFRYSEIDPRYAHESVDIWARSFTRQELAEIAHKGAPRGPSKTSLYVALSLGDFSVLRPVDPEHMRAPLNPGEEAHFLVRGVIYAQPASIESDNIEEIMERVAQGISIMPVSFQTRPKLMELQICDSGTLLITSQRYVFDGRKGQRVADLRYVLSVEAYLDGVGIERSDGAPADYFLGISADQAALTSAVFRGALKNLLSDAKLD